MSQPFGDYEIHERVESLEPGVHAFRACPRGNPRELELRVLGTPVERAGVLQDDLVPRLARVQRLSHPHLVRPLEIAVHDGRVFYTVDPGESRSLREYVRDQGGALGAELALDLLTPLAETLRYLHGEEIVHGEISVDTVRVDAVSDRAFLSILSLERLLGFPLSRGGESAAGPGVPVPPEVAAGAPWDARADLYQLGAVLYESLTGDLVPSPPPRVPREDGPDAAAPSLSGRLGAPGKELDPVVLGALALDPEERTASAQELVDALGPVKASIRRAAMLERKPTHAIRLASIHKKEAQRKATRAFAKEEKQKADERSALVRGARWLCALGVLPKVAGYLLLTGSSAALPLLVHAPLPVMASAYESTREAVRNKSFDTDRIRDDLVEVARAAEQEPTIPETYGQRLRRLRAFAKALRPEDRAEVFSAEAYAELRILYARDRKAGCARLDALLGSALRWLQGHRGDR